MFGGLSTLRTPERAEAARPPRVLPCEAEFEEYPLGTPSGFVGDPPVPNTARFTTNGEPLFITYRSDWHESGFLDFGSPEKRAWVDLGDAVSPPAFDEETSGPQNSDYEQGIDLERYVEVDPAAGDYWILISGGRRDDPFHMCPRLAMGCGACARLLAADVISPECELHDHRVDGSTEFPTDIFECPHVAESTGDMEIDGGVVSAITDDRDHLAVPH